jgi:hypothetical protein
MIFCRFRKIPEVMLEVSLTAFYIELNERKKQRKEQKKISFCFYF